MKTKIASGVLTLALAGAFPIVSSAQPELGIVGNAQVAATTIDWGTFPAGAPYATPPGYGTFEVNLVTPGGLFANNGIVTGEFGMIQSLNSGAFPPSTPFMTFTPPPGGGASLQLFVTTVTPQAPGTGCINSPFSMGDLMLCDTPNGATATLDLSGSVHGSVTPGTTNWTGTYSATFDGTTVAQLISTVAAGGVVDTPFSATFTVSATPVIPEPMTLFLMGIGLVGAALVVRRNKVRG